MSNFPDYIHLEKLRKNLWRGKAAVMIGAGFSKNARKLRLTAPPFPNWKELNAAFLQTLYPHDEQSRIKREPDSSSTSGALRLAEEYAVAFGRAELEQLLINMIPDNDYAPDYLHSLLLKLPWSDVLTTNYDSLLERGAFEIIDRKYEVVRSQEEIFGAMKPRIVKLNGSFPNNRPFIITEEDFRTYPTKFACFVNLAQQIILENTVCLLGFSGDDPNFLNWTGWVRDNLGKHSPQIYLCGLFNHTTAQRALLHKRNVIPIDLTFAPRLEFPEHSSIELKHSMATEWLLLSLEGARPFNLKYWLVDAPWKPTKPSRSGIEPLASPNLLPYMRHKRALSEVTIETINQIIEAWRYTRRNYPKWVIAPHRIRQQTKGDTEWSTILRFLPEQSIEKQFEWLYEINWRLELSLLPCWDPIQKHLINVLMRIARIENLSTDLPKVDSNSIESWLELALANLRYLREERRHHDFVIWRKLIEHYVGGFSELKQRMSHELCLEAIYRADFAEAEVRLNLWDTDGHDPIWAVRKSAIHLELGNSTEAKQLLQAALTHIRIGTRSQIDDFASLSREGWCLRLLGLINQSESLFDQAIDRVDNRERFEFLKEHLCNPNAELSELVEQIDQKPPEPPEPEPLTQDERGYDPGRITKTTKMVSDKVNLDPVYQFMRLSEQGALPVSCGNLTDSATRLRSAANWMMEFDSVRTVSLICRLSDEDTAKKYFSRHRVAAFSDDSIRDLHRCYTLCMEQSSASWSRQWQNESSPKTRIIRDRLITSIEVLSRISPRLSIEQQNLLWQFATTYIRDVSIRNDFVLPRLLHQLLERLFLNCNVKDLPQKLGELLNLPIPNEDGFNVPHADAWRDLWIQSANRVIQNKIKLTSIDTINTVQKMIANLKSSNVIVRGFAITRLMLLQDCDALKKSDLKLFAQALWGQIDQSTKLPFLATPVQTVYPIALLTFPEPTNGMAAKKVRAWLNQAEIPRYVTPDGGFRSLEDGEALFKNWLGTVPAITKSTYRRNREYISWTQSELHTFFQKIVAWWRTEGKSDFWTKGNPYGLIDFTGHFQERIHWIIGTIRRVILPTQKGLTRFVGEIDSLISDWESVNIPTDAIKPSLLRFYPKRYSGLVDQIERSIVSSDSWRIESALEGLSHWISISKNATLLPINLKPPRSLIHRLGTIFELRLVPALHGATQILEMILRDHPEYVDSVLAASLNRGLNLLLEATTYRAKTSTILGISYDDVPAYRRQAARIAWLLERNPKFLSDITSRWIEQANYDPLPEIRYALQD